MLNLVPTEVWVTAIRTNSVTEKESVIRVQISLRPAHGGQWIVGIEKGGVTGYEAFYLDQDRLTFLSQVGWMACAGTTNRWDTLYVPASSMQIVFKEFCPELFHQVYPNL